MDTKAEHLWASEGSYAVLAPVGEGMLSALPFSRMFLTAANGDPEGIGALLAEQVSRSEGQVALTVAGGEVVGLLCLAPPPPQDRFYTVPSVLMVVAAEVIPAHRRAGVLRKMLGSLLGDRLEEHILMVVVDPARRREGESARSARADTVAAFRALGFFPHPTDHSGAHRHRGATLLVRIGRGVSRWDVGELMKRLRSRREPGVRVALFVRSPDLRNLLRIELERSGYEVVAVGAGPREDTGAEVGITDSAESAVCPFTVRILDDDVVTSTGDTLWVPANRLEELPGLLRLELAQRGSPA